MKQNVDKDRVLKTLKLLEDHKFVKASKLQFDSNLIYYYKMIYPDIYVVFCHACSKSKYYSQHCFDLFLSYSKSEERIRDGISSSEFWLPSFIIDNEDHIGVFNEFMQYSMDMQPQKQFDLLRKKLPWRLNTF